MNKAKLMKITTVFFALMLCFTILSRAADQIGIAAVQTERPQNMMISHSVRAAGKVVQNQELAVTTEPDQRVTAIHVTEGQRVAKGELLFELDMTLLEEKILYEKQELEKQKLTIEDAKSQKEVSEQQKVNEQAQAAEQYALSTGSAAVRVARAREQLDAAKKELKQFQKSSGSFQEEDSIEASLEKLLEEKTDVYIQAKQELSSLEWKIENDVNTALQNAKNGAALTRNSAVYTQSPQEEDEDIFLEDSTEVTPVSAVFSDSDSVSVPASEAASGSNSGEEDFVMDAIEETDGSSAGAAGSFFDGDSGDSDMLLEEPQNSTVTQADLDRLEQSVRSSYSQQLQNARRKAEDALTQKQVAETALVRYQQERLDSGNAQNNEVQQQLLADVRAAQQAYEDAVIAANDAAVTSGRAVAAAGIANASNSADRMYEITYEQMELSLKRLEKLKKNGGKVCAKVDGIVMKIHISTGEKTSDATAILMADITKGCRFTADITKEQEKYIGVGDLVTLSGGNGKIKFEELPVESVTASEEDEDVYCVTVQVPEGNFEIGMNATMDFSRKSEAYPITIPLTALHLDEKNRPYVLVPETYDSVMGTEMRARKVSVTVQEKNESYAALADGALARDQEVITGSDKVVDDGSRVRIQ